MLHPPTTPVVESASKLLKTRILGHPLEGYYTLNSSNTLAAQKAANGATEGTVIVAEEQTAGRGRHGREWQSSAGQNLLFSIVLRPSGAPSSLGRLMLYLSLGMFAVIERWCTPLPVSIKWPNDILILQKKCCGILIESSLSNNQEINSLILGIGVNVNQLHFPEELEAGVTSLALANGRPLPRAPLLADILLSLEHEYLLFQGDESADKLVARYAKHLYRKGQRVTLNKKEPAEIIKGTLMGVQEDGGLILLTETGRQVFYSGEISFSSFG